METTLDFKANYDKSAPFLFLCLTFEYLTQLEYSWVFMHLVILMTEHQLRMPIPHAYPLVTDESCFSSTDRDVVLQIKIALAKKKMFEQKQYLMHSMDSQQ